MKHIKNNDILLVESKFDNYETIDEGFINDTIDKLVDWYKINVKGEVIKKGQYADRAKRFNKSDFIKFIRKILPSYKDLKDKEQKQEFFKQLDKYLEPLFGITGLATMFFIGSEDFREMTMNAIGTGGVLSTWFIVTVANLFEKISRRSIERTTDMEIKIEKDFSTKKVVVDFNFYYSINVKDTYRILYNSFVRLLKKYEKEEWSGIEWGVDSHFKSGEYSKKVPTFGQHKVLMDFYPKELVDLLYETSYDIYLDRKEYADENNIEYDDNLNDNKLSKDIRISFNDDSKNLGFLNYTESKNMTSVKCYIQKLSNEQIIDLSEKIDRLELEYHEPIKYISHHKIMKEND